MTSRPFLRFSLLSALVVAVIAGGFIAVVSPAVVGWQEASAARAVNQVAITPIRAALAGGDGQSLTEQQVAQIAATANPLISENVLMIRVRTMDGTVLAAHGADAGVQIPAASGISVVRSHVDGTPLFVTSARSGDYVVEVAQDSRRLDATIGTTAYQLAGFTVLFSLVAWALAQVAFWFGIHSHVQAHKRLRYLYDTGQQLRASLDLHDVLGQLITDATTHAGGRYGIVALFDARTNELLLKTTFDRGNGALTLHQRAIDEWFVHRAVATNTTVISTQAASSYRAFFGPDADIDAQSATLCVPMSIHDRVLGAVAVIRGAHTASFSASEVRLVEELAGQAATAIEQAQLFAKVRSDANELELSYDTTLKVLMAALDAKDNDTEGHCERVAKLTVQLAKAMGVPDDQIVDIERGAMLHDVGKIGVPDAVLKQPGQLNDLEWEAMRKHPLLAGLMVSKVGFLEKALPILLYHHERFDGAGYPFGLSRDSIPIEARIFSIVDAYDAMTSDRPYRAAMTHEEAMAEVRASSNTQFDPQVVEAFEAMMEERPDLHQRTPHPMHFDHDEDLDPTRRPNIIDSRSDGPDERVA